MEKGEKGGQKKKVKISQIKKGQHFHLFIAFSMKIHIWSPCKENNTDEIDDLSF